MTTTLQEINLVQIKAHKNNPRRHVGDVAELAASIVEQGIIEPLIVAPGDANVYTLIAGHRRLAAAKQAKLKTIPCLIRDDLKDPAKQLEAMLVENLQRTDLTPPEEAAAYQQLLEYPGYTMKRITTSTGRTPTTVRARLTLMKLSPAARKKIDSGQMTLADAAAIAEFADEPEMLARLEKAAGSSNTYDLKWQLDRAKRDRAALRAEARVRANLEKDGVKVWTENDLVDQVGPGPYDLVDEDDAVPTWRYVVDPATGRFDDGSDLPIKPADHTSCPGHGVILDGTITEVICTKLAEHTDLGDFKVTADIARKAAAKAKQAAEAKLDGDLASAAVVRRGHLADSLVSVGAEFGASMLRAAIVQALPNYVYAGTPGRALADVLGLPADANIKVEIPAALAKITSLEVLAVLLDIAQAENAEIDLARAAGWPAAKASYNYTANNTKRWRERLAEIYGYDWTEIEREMLTEPAKPADESDDEEPAQDVDGE